LGLGTLDNEGTEAVERTLTVSEADLLAALEEVRRDSTGEGALTATEIAEVLFGEADLTPRTKIEKTRRLLKRLQARGALHRVRKDVPGLAGMKKELAYQLRDKPGEKEE